MRNANQYTLCFVVVPGAFRRSGMRRHMHELPTDLSAEDMSIRIDA